MLLTAEPSLLSQSFSFGVYKLFRNNGIHSAFPLDRPQMSETDGRLIALL